MARSTEPEARYQARSPSAVLDTRPVSDRTVVATEKAIEASAAETQRTVSSAPPLSWGAGFSPRVASATHFLSGAKAPRGLKPALLSVVIVIEGRIAGDVDRCGHSEQREMSCVGHERGHFDSHGVGQNGLVPLGGPAAASRRMRIAGFVDESAECESIRHDDRLRTGTSRHVASARAELSDALGAGIDRFVRDQTDAA